MTGGGGFWTGFGHAVIPENRPFAVVLGLGLGPERLHRRNALAHQLESRAELRPVIGHLLGVPMPNRNRPPET